MGNRKKCTGECKSLLPALERKEANSKGEHDMQAETVCSAAERSEAAPSAETGMQTEANTTSNCKAQNRNLMQHSSEPENKPGIPRGLPLVGAPTQTEEACTQAGQAQIEEEPQPTVIAV